MRLAPEHYVKNATGLAPMLLGKLLCRRVNGENLILSEKLRLEDDGFVCDVSASPKIGIDYASPEYRDKPWRFVLMKNH